MAEIKTKATKVSVDAFLKKAATGQRLKDCYKIIDMMKKITKEEPKMWGPSIIGFGIYHYKYASGHEGDMCITGFSPRKAAFSIYLYAGLEKSAALMKKLGKYKMGKSCLWVKKLSDVDEKILAELIKDSVKYVKSYKTFPGMT
ncbi:MAG: DUF1801 domain-containing protein [Chlorobi bacterium]|nr:DUF1801 domain-containing protein [Chlorobiota bacterium]MCI0717243.1 DUF1801 domain-containing protein [Chlorobiota bacterium]